MSIAKSMPAKIMKSSLEYQDYINSHIRVLFVKKIIQWI